MARMPDVPAGSSPLVNLRGALPRKNQHPPRRRGRPPTRPSSSIASRGSRCRSSRGSRGPSSMTSAHDPTSWRAPLGAGISRWL